ncbi:hypothetical protein Rhe02_83000 [Rhizocola hellebori]|uniref:Uncharacterized protein n=1 Tax=Rhizocola hellebori TaxID=1392758 RepID=A0A8J3QFX1_9ACTN|nr:DUF5682 family protein [Rhizocola hellebori]GIH10233.1 hypothetical protein Rhe02_83000 [Rhizocola hellebori]
MSVHLFGIRHHGPGSARALAVALAELKPDLILVEGPPEADELVALAADEGLRPPVALLVYGTQEAEKSAAFWPFAVFSPEWQAIRYAVAQDVPLRFCDLPAAYKLGPRVAKPELDEEHFDPIAGLAEAAGYEDAERWWEDVIEHRSDGLSPFEAVAEAMTAVREQHPGIRYDLIREAYMRQVLRAALKQGHERIAVVCGAWHVPALAEPLPSAGADAALLKGLPKVAVSATWVPWTHGRLAHWTGYGAGVASPGWYHHLFHAADRPVHRWLVRVAGVLREQDIPVSSAHVIEAVRLAQTLAVLRGRPLPGLAELTEATRSVLCEGDETRLALVQSRVVVGELLGEVPPDTPAVPLARDVAAAQKRLRMPPQALARDLDLDLRKPLDLERSKLLHRLRLLAVPWGQPQERRAGKGTFWESWQLAWQPEFAVDLIVASAFGTTVAGAAAAKVAETAAEADLPGVTELLEACLLADLAEAQPAVLDALNRCAAMDTDVVHLMSAIPALARTLRYGDVRGTGVDALIPVLSGLVTRVQLGLPGALSGLDDEAAKALAHALDQVQEAVRLLTDRLELRDEWLATLLGLVDRPDVTGLVGGRMLRILRDEGRLSADEVQIRLARTLSVGVPSATAAAVVEGFIGGGGLVLVHDEALLGLIDRWLSELAADSFTDVLPLLRRTFATFAAPERRTIGQRVRNLGGATARSGSEQDDLAGLDLDRVAMVLPTLKLLLGSQSE